MPSVSEKQLKFMGAELSRKRSGKKTKTGMSETQLEHYASHVKGHGGGGGSPVKYKKREGGMGDCL